MTTIRNIGISTGIVKHAGGGHLSSSSFICSTSRLLEFIPRPCNGTTGGFENLGALVVRHNRHIGGGSQLFEDAIRIRSDEISNTS